MPVERRRSPAPDPKDFANPRAEKMYWATERLLDEAPIVGKLTWQDVYDGWQRVRDESLQNGETVDEAKEIAWGSVTFFIAERVADLQIEAKNVSRTQLGREVNILLTWSTVAGEALDKKSPKFNREPTSINTPLSEYPTHEIVEPGNPNSPIFAHLQALDEAADLKAISLELKTAILAHATAEKEFLEHAIDSWNNQFKLITNTEAQDPHAIASLQQSSYIILATTMAQSWGPENDAILRLNQFGEYLQRLKPQPNVFISLLNYDAIEARAAAWGEKRGLDEVREYAITDAERRKAERIRIAGNNVFDKKVVSSYVAEVAGYRHLDFGALVTWVPEEQYWLGGLMISQAGHNPPRSHSLIVRLTNAETPGQAIVGLLDYLRSHTGVITLPYKTTLSRSNIRRAVALLHEQNIMYQINMEQSDDPQ